MSCCKCCCKCCKDDGLTPWDKIKVGEFFESGLNPGQILVKLNNDSRKNSLVVVPGFELIHPVGFHTHSNIMVSRYRVVYPKF